MTLVIPLPSVKLVMRLSVKSTSLVDYYLNQLEEKEYISREGRISRSIRILKPIKSSSKKLQDKLNATARTVSAAIDSLVTIPLSGQS